MRENISFVVLNYNDATTTKKLVDALCTWEKEKFSIIVVDNQSLDNSFQCLREQYALESNVVVIQSERNGGYSYGNNYGVKYALEHFNPKYIAIANPDIQIDEKTCCELIETFNVDSSVAMVAPVMKNLNGEYRIYSQKLPTYFDDLKACFKESKSKTIEEEKLEYLDNNKKMIITQMLPGSFFVVRSKCFKEIGMFDENVFLFCEERILGKKIMIRGYKAVLRSDLFFVHAHSVSIRKTYDTIKTWKILMESRYYYEKKYNNVDFFRRIIIKTSMRIFLCRLCLKLKLYELVKGNRKECVCRK